MREREPIDDDRLLVQRAKENPHAFMHLWEKYVDQIGAYIQRETGDPDLTDDLTSATFEKAFKNLASYQDQGVPFTAWLYRIARNEMNMYWRKNNRLQPLVGRFVSPINVEQMVHTSTLHQDVVVAMDRLSVRDKDVLRLHFFEGMSHTEMAEILDCSTRNVAVRLHRALSRLRKIVDRDGGNHG